MKILAIDPAFGDGDKPMIHCLTIKNGKFRTRKAFKKVKLTIPKND